MKITFKLTGKALLTSLLLVGGLTNIANAASGDDETYKNVTLEERLYLFDGYGSKWGLDAGSDGLWFVADRPVPETYGAAFKIRNEAPNNALVIGNPDNDDDNTTVNPSAGNVGIGTDAPTVKLDVQWLDSDTANNHNLLALSVENSGSGASDAGFALENKETNFKWTFRTFNPTEGFAASKVGTGGTEFQVDNTGANTSTTVVKMGGVTIFENGALVTSSSRALKDNIEPLNTKEALEAFHKLQPVSYVYKTDIKNPVVGFIAEDVPELVAMPSHKTFNASEIVAVLTSVLAETRAELKVAQDKITELEAMQKKVAMMESILTNLALDTSNIQTDKVSLQLK